MTTLQDDYDALLQGLRSDPQLDLPPPALLTPLIQGFAGQGALAAKGLRAAVLALADLRAAATLMQSSGGALSGLLQEMMALNDQGDCAGASTSADAALAALPKTDTLQRAALTEIALLQDRIRNTPDTAAARLLAQLRGQAHPGGLFRAMHEAWEVWFDRGKAGDLAFDLTIALHLARANLDRSKGVQRVQAMADLGITQFTLGETGGEATRLKQALATFRAFVAEVPRKTDPDTWAAGMVNLGMVLHRLALHEPGPARLTEAATCLQKALQVQTQTHAPEDHATTTALLAEVAALLATRQG